jgi:hypothetical protein
MTSTGQIDTGRAQLAPAVEEGISLLWTFQLRKEHAALLERLEANERVIQARVDATSRYFQEMNERVEVLETRLAKIESEEEADRKAIEDWGAAVRTLKKKIESGMERPCVATKSEKPNCFNQLMLHRWHSSSCCRVTGTSSQLSYCYDSAQCSAES